MFILLRPWWPKQDLLEVISGLRLVVLSVLVVLPDLAATVTIEKRGDAPGSERRSGAVVLPRAQHMETKLIAVIFGQQGDPYSKSSLEALWFICWSSTSLEGQVVRPRSSSCSHWLDLLAGVELSSVLLSELGGDAWSSPACGGRGTEVLDCFLLFSSRVLFCKV
jgi:hypothetical protein